VVVVGRKNGGKNGEDEWRVESVPVHSTAGLAHEVGVKQQFAAATGRGCHERVGRGLQIGRCDFSFGADEECKAMRQDVGRDRKWLLRQKQQLLEAESFQIIIRASFMYCFVPLQDSRGGPCPLRYPVQVFPWVLSSSLLCVAVLAALQHNPLPSPA
jgi:hypothetical protein